MNYIFISHVEEDAVVALEIALGLEEAGYRTWCYEIDSIPGTSYILRTGEAVAQSEAMMVIISPHSLSSSQITKEIVRAHESDKHFIPILCNITHVEFQNRQPEWREAIGSATSIRIPNIGTGEIIPSILEGVRAFGILKSEKPDAMRISHIRKTLDEAKANLALQVGKPMPSMTPMPVKKRKSGVAQGIIMGSILVAVVVIAAVFLPRLFSNGKQEKESSATSSPSGSAQNLDQLLLIDDAKIFENRIGEVVTAAEKLLIQGAYVRVRTISTCGSVGDLDQYEAQLEKQSPSWIGQNGERKNNLIVLIISAQERQTGLYYGAYWKDIIGDKWVHVQTEIMNPLFRNGDYVGGTVKGLEEIQRLIAPTLPAFATPVPVPPTPATPVIVVPAPTPPAPGTPITVLQPDLSILDLTWSPQNPSAGEIVTFSVAIINHGKADAASFYFYFHVDDAFVKSLQIPKLSAGDTMTKTFDWAAQLGVHTVRHSADYTEMIIESDETNNIKEATLSITQQPDLVIKEITWSPTSPKATEDVIITITIENRGNGNAAPSSLEWSRFSSVGSLPKSFLSVPAIPTGGKVTKKISFMYGFKYSNEFNVDSDNVLPESDETNNSKTVTF